MSDATGAAPPPLHAATARSPVASGRIAEVHLPELPDRCIALDASDIPGRNALIHLDFSIPFLAEGSVSYVGEPVVLLAAPDREQLGGLLREVAIVCDPAAPLSDPAAPTVVRELSFERGDPGSAFESAARVIEGAYQTGFQEALGSSSHSVVAVRDERDMHITCASSDPFVLRDNVAALLDMPPARVRVHVEPAPCPIAGRMLYPMLMAGHAALIARVCTGQVRLVYTQKECLAFTPKRPPCSARYRSAIDAGGDLAGMDVELDFDAGAYPVFSAEVLERALLAACGGYHCDNVRVRARLVTSPRTPSGTFSGCGEPQTFFALERHADRVASELGLAPWEWRRRNLEGTAVFPSGMRWNRESPIELLEDVLQRSDFRRKWAAYEGVRKRRVVLAQAGGEHGDAAPLTVVGRLPAATVEDRGPLRGIGLAVAFHGLGLVAGGEGHERSMVRVLLDRNKKLHVASSQAADQQAAVWVRTAARLLDIPAEDVILEPVDTSVSPDSGSATGSRIETVLNDLVAQACRAVAGQRRKRQPPIQISRSMRRIANPLWSPGSPHGQAYYGLCWEATVVEMEIDPITFQARVRGVWTTLEGDADCRDEATQAFVEGCALYNLDYLLFDKGRYVDNAWVEAVAGEHPALGVLDMPEVHLNVLDRESTASATWRSWGSPLPARRPWSRPRACGSQPRPLPPRSWQEEPRSDHLLPPQRQ